MLHILLMILKIIGIILLVILGILLGLLLLVLFVPLRYRLHVRKVEDGPEADGCITWLLHLLRVNLLYREKQGSAELKVFGIRLKTICFPKKDKEDEEEEPVSGADSGIEIIEPSEAEPEEQERIDTTAAAGEGTGPSVTVRADAAGTVPGGEVPEDKKDAFPTEDGTSAKRQKSGKRRAARPSIIGKIIDVLERLLNLVLEQLLMIPGLPAELYDQIDRLYEKIRAKQDDFHRKVDPFLTIEAEHLFRKGIRYLKYLIRGYAPRKITGYVHFGTGEPDLTGKLTGLIFVLLPESGGEYEVDPDFYEKVFETETFAAGHIRMYRLAWVAVRVLVDKEFWRLLRMIRSKGSKGRSGKKKTHIWQRKRRSAEAA